MKEKGKGVRPLVTEINQASTLTKQEISEVNQLITTLQKKKNLSFKLNKGMIAEKNPYVHHILYRKQGVLLGYMLLSAYDPQELEVTAVFDGTHQEFMLMYTCLKQYGKEKNSKNCLFIVDQKDTLLTNIIKELDIPYAFSEYHMRFNQNHLTAFKKTKSLELLDAQEADREIIVRLNEERFDNQEITMKELMEVELEGIKLACVNGEIAGKLKVDNYQGEVGIYGFMVAPHLRGQGVGRATLEAVITTIYQNKIDKLYLEVDSTNARALHLYQSLGFSIEAKFDYYDEKYTIT
ncbi:N-acetyltransferase [Carnobacterium maltaromaticum]|uniref:GNAT family N-acetyltransferase n=1 Tax=Carnobacterium maltaromaticum TaxID=2751 RepID=UPI000C77415B|nr:GNAT family N-acetyltransferase [Carnobacterium maltaromaticum]PLS35071.1 N-acetyltransferase [Carnobacterium maltaromaticum]PLS35485.1 N-acetyltransferase [Carnobacterium maltaromaticum]PLS35935.1 N-acetyltransferase [Carnobacterium maltaromaticum]PLS42393.1 N-acetyltransferase [Carnobacterium maltaromaticum]PLS45414.1 N-acetyltransferase [Carnobacterium maltaromaticum]